MSAGRWVIEPDPDGDEGLWDTSVSPWKHLLDRVDLRSGPEADDFWAYLKGALTVPVPEPVPPVSGVDDAIPTVPLWEDETS